MEQDRTIRAFIAIELPANIIDALKKIQDELKDGSNKVAWGKPENIHLTIKFLGDIEAGKIDGITGLLEDAAAKNRSFAISVKGTGAFPKTDNPRVLWVGIEDNKNLLPLYNNLEEGLESLGLKKEERSFKPHLTLGRVKLLSDKKLFKKRIEKYKDINLGQFTAEGICLFQSKLTPNGAVYVKLKEYRLQTGD